jgi:hypothetical protein
MAGRAWTHAKTTAANVGRKIPIYALPSFAIFATSSRVGFFTKGYCNFLLFLLKVPQSKFVFN